MVVLGLHSCSDFSLVSESVGCSPVVVCGLLIVVIPLVAEHRLAGTQASVVVVSTLSCPAAYGIFWDQGPNQCLLQWQMDSTTEPPGKPSVV